MRTLTMHPSPLAQAGVIAPGSDQVPTIVEMYHPGEAYT